VAEGEHPPVLVIGVGNELRGDDAAGVEVARRLREDERAGSIDVEDEQNDATALIDRWLGRDSVVLVDAVEGPNAGAIYRLDASSRPLPSWPRTSSTHAVGLAETIELARALGQLPARVVVYALEGHRFEAGAALSEPVAGALAELVERVLAEAVELASNP
jgi:hydrogenase maturation protease